MNEFLDDVRRIAMLKNRVAKLSFTFVQAAVEFGKIYVSPKGNRKSPEVLCPVKVTNQISVRTSFAELKREQIIAIGRADGLQIMVNLMENSSILINKLSVITNRAVNFSVLPPIEVVTNET